jgi:hypothetical protein
MFINMAALYRLLFFLNWYSGGGGVQLGPLGTAATNRPLMPNPGDYDDGEISGMIIGRGNRSTRRKPAPLSLCPPQIPNACPDANPGRCGGKTAINRLSYGTAVGYSWYQIILSTLHRPTSSNWLYNIYYRKQEMCHCLIHFLCALNSEVH